MTLQLILTFWSVPIHFSHSKIFSDEDFWRVEIPLTGLPYVGTCSLFPEPHILGKIKWIAGGAVGMQPLDWFDAIFHGTPWLLMIGFLIGKASQFRKQVKN